MHKLGKKCGVESRLVSTRTAFWLQGMQDSRSSNHGIFTHGPQRKMKHKDKFIPPLPQFIVSKPQILVPLGPEF